MISCRYADVLLPLPIHGTFTYAVEREKAIGLKPGMRVTVRFGKKQVYTALVLRVHDDKPPNYEVKEIVGILDQEPVVLHSQLSLWQWMSEYYMCPLGEIFKAAMPAGLDLSRKTRKKQEKETEVSNRISILNTSQQIALKEIHTAFLKSEVALLHGITSSGKTEIYIHLIREALDRNMQVLYLLPEIALTTQIITRLTMAFGSGVAVYHSKYSNSERIRTWKKMLNNTKGDQSVQVVLGVRSAIFLPFQNPGLIIIDEEHENTYKQFDPAPRYHARDTAIMMAKFQGAKVLLGTATPSIETYYNCLSGKYRLINLNERYLNLQLPEIVVENTRELKRRKQMSSNFSPALLANINEALQNGEQVILFQNRRGFSLYLECENCGEVPKCKRCDVCLTYHKNHNRLYCHYCGYNIVVPSTCPACNTGKLQMRGFGTEKIEEEIAGFFPDARIERLDLDATRKSKSFEKIITRFELKEADILVGTQMVSKGLDFDNVKLVGIMNADTMLNYPDFRAHERSYQLMAQVSGRAGRKNSQGKVIIQTTFKDHPVISYVINNDYLALYNMQIEERKNFSYPPFSRLIKITLKHRDKQLLDKAADYLLSHIQRSIHEKIMGPEYPLISRLHNLYLKNLLIKIEKGSTLASSKEHILNEIRIMKENPEFRPVQYTIDVDPY